MSLGATAHQAQVDSPEQAHGATNHDAILQRHKRKVDNADQRPQFQTREDQWPKSVPAIGCNGVERPSSHGVNASNEEQRIDRRSQRLVQQELDCSVPEIERLVR